MDYLQEAFGGFNPQSDIDASIKFALNIILMDERFTELSCLLVDGHEIGGIGGEPGWIIERRDTGPSGDMPGYADWPSNAYFHAHVYTDVFQLAYPDIFMETKQFHAYVSKGLQAYVAVNPSKINAVQSVISLLQS